MQRHFHLAGPFVGRQLSLRGDVLGHGLLLSTTEVYGNLQSDGTQYEFYKSKGVTSRRHNGASSKFTYHWTRSVSQSNAASFYYICSDGSSSYGPAASTPSFVFPAWCF